MRFMNDRAIPEDRDGLDGLGGVPAAAQRCGGERLRRTDVVPALPPRLRIVEPTPEERYVTCVPLVPLKAAAGAFGDPQHVEDDDFEWVAVESTPPPAPGHVRRPGRRQVHGARHPGRLVLPLPRARRRHAAGQDRARPASRRHRPRDRRALHRQALREREGARMATPGVTPGSP